MIIPSTVRVGHLTYTISPFTEDEIEASEAHGLCSFDRSVIKYDPKLTCVLILETILHEVSHAVNDFAYLTDKSSEEEFVSKSTPVWMMVWRDNPALFELLRQYAQTEIV